MTTSQYIDEIIGHPEIKHGLTVFDFSELRGLNLLNKIDISRCEDGKTVIVPNIVTLSMSKAYASGTTMSSRCGS